MNYISLIGCDTANGNGVRVSLFVSGCEHKCPGCFNPESHDPNAGKPFDDSVKQKIFAELGKDYALAYHCLEEIHCQNTATSERLSFSYAKKSKRSFRTKTYGSGLVQS